MTVERHALFPNGEKSLSPGFDAQRRTLGQGVRDITTPTGLHHLGLTGPDDGTPSEFGRSVHLNPG